MELLEQDYRRSTFTHLLQNDGVFCLYNSLTMQKLYGDETLQDIFQSFQSFNKPIELFYERFGDSEAHFTDFALLMEKLVAKKILIASDDEENNLLAKRRQRAQSMKDISLMYFIPTTQCNYACSYCFVEDKIEDVVFMTKDVSRKGLDFFAAQSQNSREIKVVFYGGEPLLNKEVVYDAIQYIRQLEEDGKFSKKVRITLLTNGSLVDEGTVDVCKKYEVKTSVSIDGPESVHDKTRFLPGRHGSWKQSVKGYKLLQESGLKPSISCTLNQYNIDKFDETLSFIVEELKPLGLGFNILMPKWNEAHTEEVDVDLATSKIIEAFKKLRKLGIYEDRMMRRVRPFSLDRFHYKDCYGVGGQIVLTPEGKIGPCQAYLGVNSYFPVSLDKLPDDVNSHPMFAKWSERFPLNNSECLSCRALAVCGGGCPYAAEVASGSIDGIDRRVCKQCLTIFDWLIWDLYEQLQEDSHGT